MMNSLSLYVIHCNFSVHDYVLQYSTVPCLVCFILSSLKFQQPSFRSHNVTEYCQFCANKTPDWFFSFSLGHYAGHALPLT